MRLCAAQRWSVGLIAYPLFSRAEEPVRRRWMPSVGTVLREAEADAAVCRAAVKRRVDWVPTFFSR